MSLLDRFFRMFETTADPYFLQREPLSQNVWRFLWQNLRPLRKPILFSLILTVIAVSIEVWLIAFAGRLIDLLTATDPAQLWAEHGMMLLGVAAIILILRPIIHISREAMNDLGFKPNAATLFRWRAFRQVSQQSVGWFQQDLAGRTAMRVVESGSAAAGAVYSVLNTILYVGTYMIGILLLMGSVDLRLAIPIVAWFVLYAVLMRLLVPKFDVENEKFHAARAELAGELVDTYSNIDTVKLFADSRAYEQDAHEKFEATRQQFFGLQRVEVTLNTLINWLEGLIMVGLVGYGILLWQTDAASLGLVSAAMALSFKVTSMAEWVVDAVAQLFSHIGALRDALSVIAQPVDIPEAEGAVPLRISGGEIRFDGVTHHYGKGRDGLDQVSLIVAAGEKVGIVGRSGAGKSSLVNLVLRFFELEGGDILIDGQSIRSVTQDSLRGAIGMVTQDAALLHRSVRDNIAFGKDGVSDAQIEAAAKQAEAHEFVERLEDQNGCKGYDAQVGDRGVKLSGGQRQRIAIARVILKNAPILILDEATSALDSEVEAAIQDTLYGVMEGKTVIAIAHRLSTIAQMDRIIVLDQGRIAEQGTHSDLLAQNGLYAGFWNRQSGGFIGADD